MKHAMKKCPKGLKQFLLKPFLIGTDYIDWAHGPGAEDGQPLAMRICASPITNGKHSVDDPVLVAEIADVAELYVGGPDNDLRAARQRGRALDWLADRGFSLAEIRAMLRDAHK